MSPKQDDSGWTEPKTTALLVLADGTVLEGFGLGATGRAVGEVCFNTAMTGYEEILTDPSYAGQIITFTFPHIGNVGTNEEDIETVNLAATPGARGVILHAPITEPSNFRATRHLDQWLKARGIIGLSGLDTRALTALIRVKGMPNAVIAHDPSGKFDLDALKQEAREWPGLVGMDLVPMVTSAPALHLGRDALAVGQGLRPPDRARVPRGRDRLRHQAQHPAPARGLRLPRHGGAGQDRGRGDFRAQARRRVPVERPRRSRRHRRICRAGDPQADRQRHADLRHLPRPPDAGHRARRAHDEDAPGPSRRQPSGQGPRHRQGRDHLDEPRLRGRQGLACPRTSSRPTSRCSTARTAALRSRTCRCSRCSTIPRRRPARATAIICSRASSN